MTLTSSEYRTHSCGQLRSSDVGSQVKLAGWIHRKRDHGGVLFIDLRDHYGISQLVTSAQDPGLAKLDATAYEQLERLSNESVISIFGTVVARTAETINKDNNTGEIEIIIESYRIESVAKELPFAINNASEQVNEELRLTYRFLDLRREKLHANIMLRNKVIRYLRDKMHSLGFNEFQTPILTASSPEGARDFLVPSRMHPGKFYALPQAPQQFKQLLMMSGFDRYFQIAPCFRDEDARADRAPGEFYQLDIEMSFVTQEDVFATIEPVMHGVFSAFARNKTVTNYPFPRITYAESMLRYGSDKPDLRNPLIIHDVTALFAHANFAIFRDAISNGAIVRAIPAPQSADKPRSFFDNMIAYAQSLKAKGLAYLAFDAQLEAKGPIAKVLSPEQIEAIREKCSIKAGDAVFFTCEKENIAAKLAGQIRDKLGHELALIDSNSYKFCWIIDFPMYEWDENTKKIEFSHNPFSMPQGGMDALLAAENDRDKTLALRAYQYDIVCNGIELSSGAIRNHSPEIMYKAFSMAGYNREEVDSRFEGMINALRFGPPPHGGIAPGIDRMVMLLAEEPNIREVIAFPLNQRGEDLLMGAPNVASSQQLKELHIASTYVKPAPTP